MANLVEIVISAKDQASSVLQSVGREASTLGTGVGTLASGPFAALGNAGDGLKGKLGSLVSEGFGKAKESAGELSGALSGLPAMLTGIGAVAAIGGGLTEGLAGGISALQQLAGQTKTLQTQTGMTAESASGMLAVFQRFGVDSDGASKALGIFSKGLSGIEQQEDGTGKASAVVLNSIKNLGITIDDASGNLRPMNDILGDVADRFKDMPNGPEKTALAMQLFGKSGKDLLPILNQGKDGIAGLEEEAAKMGLTLSQGNVDAVKKFGAAQKDMNEALEGMKIQIGSALLPILTVFVQNTSQLVTMFVEHAVPTIRAFGQAIGDYVVPIIKAFLDTGKMVLTTFLTPIIDLFKTAATGAKGLGDGISPLKNLFNNIMESFKTFQSAFTGTWTDTSKLSTLQRIVGVLGEAFGTVRNMVVTFVQAITGHWVDDSRIDVFSRIVGNVATLIKDLVGDMQPLIDKFKEAFGLFASGDFGGGISKLFDGIGETLKNFGSTLGDLVSKWGPPLLSALGDLAGKLLSWAGDQVQPLLTKLGEWATAFLGWVGPLISPMLAKLGEIATAVITWLGNQVQPLLTKLGDWAKAFIDWIGPNIQPMIGKLGDLIDAVVTWVANEAPKLVDALAHWAAEFLAWIAPQIPPLLVELGKFLVAATGWIIEQIPTVVATLVKWADELVAWIGPKVTPMLAELGKLLVELTDWATTTALPAIVSKLVEWGKAFFGWVAKDALPSLPGELLKIVTAVLTFVATAELDIATKLVEWGTKFLEWVALDVLPKLPGEPLKIATTILTWIAEKEIDFASKLIEWGTKFLEWVVLDVIPKLPGEIEKIATTILTWIGQKELDLATKLKDWVTKFLEWTGDVVTGLPGKLADILKSVTDWIPNAATTIKNSVQPIIDALTHPFDTAKSGIETILNGIRNAVNWVGNKLQVGDLIPSIPGFAKGGITPGGVAMVGEEGPELAIFPTGTQIIPHGQSMAMMGRGGNPFGAVGDAVGGFASDVASSVGSFIAQGADQILNLAFSAVGVGNPLTGAFKDMGAGLLKMMKDAALGAIKELIADVKNSLPKPQGATNLGGGTTSYDYQGSDPVVQAALSMLSSNGAQWNGWCEKFVGDVADRVGAGRPRMATAADHLDSISVNPGYGPPGTVQYWGRAFDPNGHVDINGPDQGQGISTGPWGVGVIGQYGGTAGWAPIQYDKGGWIPEPVMGVGASGQRYSFAEHRPEYVNPSGPAGTTISGPVTINIACATDAQARAAGKSVTDVLQAARRSGLPG